MSAENQRSLWWVLLPVLVGLIGGIIAYFVLRHDDLKLAKFCFNLSIVLTAINLIAIIPIMLWAGYAGLDSSMGVNI